MKKNPQREYLDYRRLTQNKLKKLMPIFARAAIGDFSRSLPIPQQEDDFTDLYVGLQIMIEVIREQKAELQATNKKLRQTILERTADLRRVAEEKAKLDVVLNSMGEGLIVTDEEQRVVIANKAASDMLRCSHQQLIGQSWLKAVKIYDANKKPLPPKRSAFIRSQRKRKTISVLAEFFGRRDGASFPVAVTSAPIITDDKTAGAVTVFRDVTRELEIEQTRQEFVALASHQLRTPISIIKWYAQILAKRGSNLTSTQTKYLGEINQASNRMNTLITSLLDIAKVETGKYLVKPAVLNLGEYVHDIVQGIQTQADFKDVSIKEKYPLQPLHIETDPKVVRVAVENLISNAIKFSKSPSTINVEVAEQAADSQLGGQIVRKPSAVITVKDRGQGIPKDQQEQIFKRMFNPAQGGGSGLGLYLTKAVIDHADGEIWFTSQHQRGSSFFVSFPLTANKV